MSIVKKTFKILLVSVLVVILGFFLLLNIAFQPTEDGKRINSDTNMKMLVDLPNSTPSRSITFTTENLNDSNEYKNKIEKYKNSALGKVEGDIPCVILEENPKITLHFQDSYYNNIFPDKIKNVTADLINVVVDDRNTTAQSLEYSSEDNCITIDSKQIEYERDKESGEIWYNMVISVEYEVKGSKYTSITAVTVFDK